MRAYVAGIVSDVILTDSIIGKLIDRIRVQIDDRLEDPIIRYVNYEINAGL